MRTGNDETWLPRALAVAVEPALGLGVLPNLDERERIEVRADLRHQPLRLRRARIFEGKCIADEVSDAG